MVSSVLNEGCYEGFDEVIRSLQLRDSVVLDRAARLPVAYMFTLRELLRRQPVRATFTKVCILAWLLVDDTMYSWLQIY